MILGALTQYATLAKWAAVGTLIAVTVGYVGYQSLTIGKLRLRLDIQSHVIDQAKARATEQDLRFRAREERWKLEQKEARVAHEKAVAQLRADVAVADAAAGRLRDRTRTLDADVRRGAADPSAAGDGPTADTALDLLADMSGRLDEAAGILAEYAQAARNAGQQCVSNYEALTHE